VPDPVFFGVDRLYYVVPPVEEFVANDLYHNPLLLQPLHHYHRHVLVLVASQHRAQNDIMYPAVAVVRYGNVVNPPVTVKVEVVDPRIPVVETSLEGFKGGGIAEQVQNRIKVQVVTRETQVLLREVLCPDCRR
jgi:hypothetical protein